MQDRSHRNPWAFVPVLYFLQAIPVMVIQGMAGVMYTNLGVKVSTLALWTSLLKLPWTLKPLWAPLVDLVSRKRRWILAMQALISLLFVAAAFAVTGSAFFAATVAVFGVMAFASATHDIAADGFYLLSLDKKEQAAFVGIRSAAFRLGTLFATFLLVYIAGAFEESGDIPRAWFFALLVAGGTYLLFALVNAVAMPHPELDLPAPPEVAGNQWSAFAQAFGAFFGQDRIAAILLFILFFRFGESMITTLQAPFLLKPPAEGGIGIDTKAQGFVGGAVGVLALVFGGIFGGWLISRLGLRKCLWPMVAALNLPNLAYLWLAWSKPVSPVNEMIVNVPDLQLFTGEWFSHVGRLFAAAFTDPVGIVVAIDQFGYGFGFSAYLVYLMQVSQGRRHFQASMYAIATGLMSLGALLAGSISGFIRDAMEAMFPGQGFFGFFVVVMMATVPGMLSLFFIPLDDANLQELPADEQP